MKKIFCYVLAVMIMLSLCACAPSKEDIVGRWNGVEESSVLGIAATPSISFSENGTFYAGLRIVSTDDLFSSTMCYGEWTLDGSTVTLTYWTNPILGDGSVETLTYSNGKLINANDVAYEKVGGFYDD